MSLGVLLEAPSGAVGEVLVEVSPGLLPRLPFVVLSVALIAVHSLSLGVLLGAPSGAVGEVLVEVSPGLLPRLPFVVLSVALIAVHSLVCPTTLDDFERDDDVLV